jgi:hypothetical protein
VLLNATTNVTVPFLKGPIELVNGVVVGEATVSVSGYEVLVELQLLANVTLSTGGLLQYEYLTSLDLLSAKLDAPACRLPSLLDLSIQPLSGLSGTVLSLPLDVLFGGSASSCRRVPVALFTEVQLVGTVLGLVGQVLDLVRGAARGVRAGLRGLGLVARGAGGRGAVLVARAG